MIADLHIHSNYSDGTSSIEEIMSAAHHKGINVLGITDHENTEGIEKAKQIGISYGIEIIPGVELCSFFRNEEIHLLAYYKSVDNDYLQEKLKNLRQERAKISWAMYQELKRNGIELDWEKIEEDSGALGIIYKGHIMRTLWKTTSQLKPLDWKNIASWFKPGGMAYVPYKENSFTDTVDFIFATGGLPVLAHPGLIRNQKLMADLLSYKPIGLEVYYGYWEDQQELISRYEKIAQEKAILSTGGSDFHGSFSPIGLGEVVVPSNCVANIKNYLSIE